MLPNDRLTDDITAFADWLATPLGQYIWQREQAFFDQAVADIFGYYALQLGLPRHICLQSSRIATHVVAGWQAECDVQSDWQQLPFASASVDLLVLPHTLDLHPNPRRVLREVERVLVPDGRLLLTGFNPWSIWGIVRAYRNRQQSCSPTQSMPWRGNFIGLSRMKDWLALLGLEPVSGRMHCYVPPFATEKWLQRYRFMELAGDRWWPVGGAVYCLDVIKRVHGMKLILPAWKKSRKPRKKASLVVTTQGWQQNNLKKKS